MFFFQVVTNFLGVNISRLNLGMTGNGILIAWTIWVILFPITMEIFGFIFKNKKSKRNQKILNFN